MQHNLRKYPGENKGQTNFYTMKCLKWKKSYPTTYMDELEGMGGVGGGGGRGGVGFET